MPSQSPFLDTVLNPPPPTTTTPPSTTSSSPSSTTSTMSFSHADTAQIQAQIQAQLQAQAQAQAQVQAEVQAQVQAQAQAHQAQVQAQAQAQAQAQLQIQLHVQAQPFNATQQSLQSRNKPFTNQQTTTTTSPHRQRNSSSRSGSGSGGESFTARQRRLEAVSVLENSELLLWVSAERNEVRFLLFLFFPLVPFPSLLFLSTFLIIFVLSF
ncbi:hypothetical protein EJ04DRAFT_112295 [Polyplosphaeria fusca]|uniref:Uncharacterized protein n=1 Tax=Polyplosphaeria fusca TaxID=682080 RepID=A0A9P4RCD7_9PLEO|nr:hypothetical protein EJ04DRAFT_112295 [Polyplosphaeria fusca]